MPSPFPVRSSTEYGEGWTAEETLIQSSILVYVLLIITALQLRSALLWSESWILRKLRALQERKTDREIARDAYGSSTGPNGRTREEIFSKLYISLSKGRHRGVGRLYRLLYLLFFYSIDLIDAVPLRRVELISSTEVIIAFRVSLYWGSLTVLGARQLTVVEWGVTILLCIVYGFSILWASIFQFRISHFAKIALLVVRTIPVLLSVIFEILEAHRFRKNKSEHIASIANTIRQNGVFTGRQKTRFTEMSAYVREDSTVQNPTQPRRGERYGKYFPNRFRWEFIAAVTLILTNGLVWNPSETIYIPELVATEVFELISFILFIFNDSQVEPRLFVELLKVTEALGGSHINDTV